MLRILLVLVPSTLIVILFFVFYSKNEAKPAFCFEPIPDENVAIDVKAVNLAIDSMGHEELWGIRPVEDSVERKLTAAQGALFRRYWEMETIQNEKPGAPEQLDLELFGEALDELVRMDELEARVKFDVDGFEEWAKRKEQMGGEGDLCAQKVVKGYSEGENGPIGIAKLALTKMMDGNLEVKKVKIEEKIEYEGIGVGGRKKRSINFEGKKGKILALKKYLMENLMKTADGKHRKRDEKLAYIWYAELEYWLAKQFERRGIMHPDEQIEGIIGVNEEVDFLAKEWAKSTEKLAKLRLWIGKEYRRRK